MNSSWRFPSASCGTISFIECGDEEIASIALPLPGNAGARLAHLGTDAVGPASRPGRVKEEAIGTIARRIRYRDRLQCSRRQPLQNHPMRGLIA